MTEYTEQEIAKARELLADVMKGDGSEGAAMWLLAGKPTDIADFHALQAICAALRTASQGDGNSVLVDRGALQLAINVLQRAGKDEVAEALRQATPASASGSGHAVIEAALAKAVAAKPEDAPFGMSPEEARIWHAAHASAYQHALEMMPASGEGQQE